MFVVHPVYSGSKVRILFVVRLLENRGFAVSHVTVNTFCVGTFAEIENCEADHV
jgi:capsular polysaccharide biosynthesis protein